LRVSQFQNHSSPQGSPTPDITYGSVCGGIEAAAQAWHPLGMRAAWFAEIEPLLRYCIIPLGKRAFTT